MTRGLGGLWEQVQFSGQVPCHKFTPRADVPGRCFNWEVKDCTAQGFCTGLSLLGLAFIGE